MVLSIMLFLIGGICIDDYPYLGFCRLVRDRGSKNKVIVLEYLKKWKIVCVCVELLTNVTADRVICICATVKKVRKGS